VVQRLEPADAGVYTCQVSALTPILIQHRVTIRTRPAIQVEQAPRLTTTAGRQLALTCAVLAGSPEPRLRWRRRSKGGGTSAKTTENVVVGEGRRLVLEHVAKEDAGTYTCEADNGFSEEPVTSSMELEVHCEFLLFCRCALSDLDPFLYHYKIV
jgi:hypothetical protein